MAESGQESRKAHEFALAILRSSPVPLLVLESDLRVFLANEAFYKSFQVGPKETEGRLVYELGNGQWDIPRLRTLLELILPRQSWFERFEVTHEFETIGPRTMLLNARRLETRDIEPPELTGRIVLVIEDITDRKRTEESLRESEQKFSFLFEKAAFATALATLPEGKFVDVNEKFVELFGYPKEELIGRTSLEIGLNPDTETRQRILAKLQQEGFAHDQEVSLFTKSGERRTFLNNISLTRFGGEDYVLTTAIDITDRRRTEEALHESEATLKAVTDNVPVLISYVDAVHHYRFVNRTYKEWFGLEPGEVVGKHIREVVGEAAYQDILPNIERALSGESFRFETFVPYERGGSRFIVADYVSDIAPDGVVKGFYALIHDLTERKKAEDANAQLAAIVESSDDAIVSKDLNGVITSWNMGAQRLFGYSAEEAIGKSVLMLIPDDHKDEEPMILSRIRRGESVDHYETVRRRKDGTLVDISLTVSPIRDSRGEVIGASKVARNITEQKRAEAAVRAMNAELEGRVAERTAELQAAVKQLEGFCYSVSHDFRAPLRAINASAMMLQQDFAQELPEEAKQILSRQTANATRMGHLIDALLQFSRVGRVELKKEQFDLSALALEVVGELKKERDCQGVDINVQSGLKSEGDPNLVKLVLHNLLGNACKFRRAGEPQSVELGRDDDGFYVTDNGVGFEPSYVENLFQPFHRLHSEAEFPGTGIGLANVKRVVERHGGRVWAESAGPGKGATFRFTLPDA